MIFAVDYFTKWMEAEPLASITENNTSKFIWKNIIPQYGVSNFEVSDNGTYF